MTKMKRKLMIVIEDTDFGEFMVYLDGHKERIGEVSDKELTSAEAWAFKLFLHCKQLVEKSGATEKEELLWH